MDGVQLARFKLALREYEAERSMVMWLIGGHKWNGSDVYAYDIYAHDMDPGLVDFIHPDAKRLYEEYCGGSDA